MSSREKLLEISSMQQWNGSFPLDAKFAQCFNVNVTTVQLEANKHNWNLNAYASVIALVYLDKKLNELKDDWELIADKSKNWLLNNYREKADEMYEAAIKLVK